MQRFIVFLRWVALLPVAVGAAWAAWFAVKLLNRIGMAAMGLSPLYERAGIEALSGAAMGAAFVYAGAMIAPTHRKQAAYALGGVGLIVLSAALYYAAT